MTREDIDRIASEYFNDKESEHEMDEVFDLAKKALEERKEDMFGEIIAGLRAHKWNKDEGSKAIYDSAINDAVTYIEEYMDRDAEAQATELLTEARECAEESS